MSIRELLLAGLRRFVQGHSFWVSLRIVRVTLWIVRRYPVEISALPCGKLRGNPVDKSGWLGDFRGHRFQGK